MNEQPTSHLPPAGPQPVVVGTVLGKIFTGVALIYLLGSLVYSIWAMCGEPAEPAATFIHWQATWGDGRYYLKATFLATWFHLLGVPALVCSCAWAPWYAVTALSAPKPAPLPANETWRALPAKGVKTWVLAVLFGLVPGTLAYLVLLIDPEQLAFTGTGSIAVLILLPLLFGFGWIGLLNLALPRRRVIGPVESLVIQRDQKNNIVAHLMRVGGINWGVPPETFAMLNTNMVIEVVAPAVTATPFSLRVRDTVHYR
ncbi:MAG: hypothetical protein Q8Q09_05665 [Deltaproteobacteria bacterium]|nr:hypothetical protein [Deltaproteobacteria bacterium]